MENLTIAFYWYIENLMIITYILFIIYFIVSLSLHRLQSKMIEKQDKIIALHEKTSKDVLRSYFKESLEEVRKNSKKKNLTISKIEKRALIYQNVALSLQMGDKEAKFIMFQDLTQEKLRLMIEEKKKYVREMKMKENIGQNKNKK